MDTHVFYYPLKDLGDGEFLAVEIGGPSLVLGESVSLTDNHSRTEIEDLYVASVDSFPAGEVPTDLLSELGVPSAEQFMRQLSGSYRTGLPKDVMVTVYRFTQDAMLIEEVVIEPAIFHGDEPVMVEVPVNHYHGKKSRRRKNN